VGVFFPEHSVHATLYRHTVHFKLGWTLQSKYSVKPPPLRFSDIFPKRLGILNQFYTPIARFYLR